MFGSNRILFVLSILIAIFFKTFSAHADEIPGYIGHQTFRLSDDQGLSDMLRRVGEAKVEMARADEVRVQTTRQMNDIQKQFNSIRLQMDELNKTFEQLKISKKDLNDKLTELKKSPDANKDQITDMEKQIASVEETITQNLQSLGALKLQTGPLNVRIDQLKMELARADERYKGAESALINLNRDVEIYRNQLINAILTINRDGARNGFNDGGNDGARLARQLGVDLGSRDGDRDGYEVGTRDGQDRYYRRGAEQGERDGSARAAIDGNRDGTNEGTRDGNISAGNREGNIAGIKRAEASDAGTVGSVQGKKAGFERAVVEGRIKGENLGEEETVEKFESINLNTIAIDGPFAGAFSRRTPDYPGDFNGPSFNPNTYNSKDLLRRAYSDGYIFKYRENTRAIFYRNIDGDYNSTYDSHYSSAYTYAVNKEYPEYFEQGRKEADLRAYNRDYPLVKRAAYDQAFRLFDNNPTRTSGEYKIAFSNAEVNAFEIRYEAIRRINFDREELLTFNSNIANQTEIFRQKRITEVTNIYNNNAILSFVSSDMLDGGIKNIAKLDGVFQPGETTLHNIVIKNFGAKNAESVSVQLDNGSLVKIPSIPAKSIAFIKGAGASLIPANSNLGSSATTSLKVISLLTSDDAVEAIHFDKMSGGVLKTADLKKTQVNFPFSIAGLALESQLLKNNKNKLNLTVSNNSNRPYTGEMKIKVLVNSQNPLITKDFSIINNLKNASAVLMNDAEVLVTSEADVYRDLSFSASLELEGVTLGRITNDLMTMAKAQFLEKAGTPVIVINSDNTHSRFQDALSLLGGTEKVSILDLSLSNLNSNIINSGLNSKVIIVVDDEKSSSIKTLNTFFTKSKNSSFVLVDEAKKGLNSLLGLPVMTDATKLLWDDRRVFFSNPLRSTGVEKSSSFAEATMDNLISFLPTAYNLSLNGTELLNTLKNEINRNTYFATNNNLRAYGLKALAEVLNIDTAYLASGGVFSRDKKIAELVDKDGSLLINLVKAASANGVNEGNLPGILIAIAVRETLLSATSYYGPISSKISMKVKNKISDNVTNTENAFKKKLQKFDSKLYTNAYNKAKLHRPFFIPNDSFPTDDPTAPPFPM